MFTTTSDFDVTISIKYLKVLLCLCLLKQNLSQATFDYDVTSY